MKAFLIATVLSFTGLPLSMDALSLPDWAGDVTAGTILTVLIVVMYRHITKTKAATEAKEAATEIAHKAEKDKIEAEKKALQEKVDNEKDQEIKELKELVRRLKKDA